MTFEVWINEIRLGGIGMGWLDSDLAFSLVFGGCLIRIGVVGGLEGLQAGVCILAFVGRERSDSCERRGHGVYI